MSFMPKEWVYDAYDAFFKVLAKKGGRKPILFGRFEAKVKVLGPSKTKEGPLEFNQLNSKVICMVQNMGCNFRDKHVLNFSKGVRTQPLPSTLNGKSNDYYHRTKRELGYIFDFYASTSEFDDSVCHKHLSIMLSWETDYCIRELFMGLRVNMALISHLVEDEDEGIL